MRVRSALSLVGIVALTSLGSAVSLSTAAPVVHPNPNTSRAGVLRNGVLSVTLEAKKSLLHLDGPARPAMTIEAFAEPGHAPTRRRFITTSDVRNSQPLRWLGAVRRETR